MNLNKILLSGTITDIKKRYNVCLFVTISFAHYETHEVTVKIPFESVDTSTLAKGTEIIIIGHIETKGVETDTNIKTEPEIVAEEIHIISETKSADELLEVEYDLPIIENLEL